MLTRFVTLLFLVLAPVPALADRTDDVRDYIVRELREDGYRDIRVSRTLLGRMRFTASRNDARREIVVNPRTGEIIRDYIRFLRSGGGTASGGYGQSYDDDNSGSGSYNSGSGSNNSGSGSNNSGSGSGNSGSGSSNSGSGSSSSGSGSSGSDDDD